MKEKRFLSLILFIAAFSLSAQVKGIVKDNSTGEPIPFVNIWVENENIGTTTEINGTFSINVKEKDKKLNLELEEILSAKQLKKWKKYKASVKKK